MIYPYIFLLPMHRPIFPVKEVWNPEMVVFARAAWKVWIVTEVQNYTWNEMEKKNKKKKNLTLQWSWEMLLGLQFT